MKSVRQIEIKMRFYDNRSWREQIENKTSVEMYKRFKRRVGEDKIYDNRRVRNSLSS